MLGAESRPTLSREIGEYLAVVKENGVNEYSVNRGVHFVDRHNDGGGGIKRIRRRTGGGENESLGKRKRVYPWLKRKN